MSSKLLLSLFKYFSLNIVFHSEQNCYNSRSDIFKCYFHVSNLIQTFQTDWFDYSNKCSLVIHNSCSIDDHVSCHKTCIKRGTKLTLNVIKHHSDRAGTNRGEGGIRTYWRDQRLRQWWIGAVILGTGIGAKAVTDMNSYLR